MQKFSSKKKWKIPITVWFDFLMILITRSVFILISKILGRSIIMKFHCLYYLRLPDCFHCKSFKITKEEKEKKNFSILRILEQVNGLFHVRLSSCSLFAISTSMDSSFELLFIFSSLPTSWPIPNAVQWSLLPNIQSER